MRSWSQGSRSRNALNPLQGIATRILIPLISTCAGIPSQCAQSPSGDCNGGVHAEVHPRPLERRVAMRSIPVRGLQPGPPGHRHHRTHPAAVATRPISFRALQRRPSPRGLSSDQTSSLVAMRSILLAETQLLPAPRYPRPFRFAFGAARIQCFRAFTRSQSPGSWLEAGDTDDSGCSFRYRLDPSSPASAHRAAAGWGVSARHARTLALGQPRLRTRTGYRMPPTRPPVRRTPDPGAPPRCSRPLSTRHVPGPATGAVRPARSTSDATASPPSC